MGSVMKRTLLPVLVALASLSAAKAQSPAGWAGAMWVWDEADAHQTAQNNEPRFLRRVFDLAAKPAAAELWITADNHYVVHVNGQQIGSDGEWSSVEKYDVAKHLKVGKNVLAIKATNQGGPAGALARLAIKTADKKDLFIVTDDRCRITQKAGNDWLNPDLDDSSWFAAVVLGDPGIGPWNIAGAATAQGKKGGAKGYDTTDVDPKIKNRLSAQEQQKHFIVPKDFEIELVAADPLVINPITMVMDDKGRIIVSESHTYRYGPPGSPIKPYSNPVIRLDPDGKGGFTRTLIADGFIDPVMGIAVKGNKLWLTACDYLYTYDLPAAGEAKGEKAKDVRRPLDEKQKEQLKKALAVAANRFAEMEIRMEAVGQIRQMDHPDAVDALLTLLPGDRDEFTIKLAKFSLYPHSPKVLAALAKLADPPTREELLRSSVVPVQYPDITREIKAIARWAAQEIKAKQKETPKATEGKAIATNKKLLLKDHSKAWNPFGMFVLEWGPDGKLYMSVGNHNINIEGPDGKLSSRGGSGLIMRMNPDGTKMERLVHGLRVPYSFEYDPFGQLWLLSNGEGNPNRFVRVIEGVDYHCYSRGAVDNNWLAGNHPLAPPCEELHRGAHTQLMRYYGAAYPKEFQGNLLLCNWGAHGFAGPNRTISRFITDERNNIVGREPLVHCSDPHFRPSHIILDQDGSLLISDWYGRDDESDMTGRIWRLKYVGKERPVVKHKLDSPEWKNDAYAISALGSPSHLIREKAMHELLQRRPGDVLDKLRTHAAEAKDPIGAANALWLLHPMGESKSQNYLFAGATHPDWKVRRLAVNLGRRSAFEHTCSVNEKDPAVLLENAIARASTGSREEAIGKGPTRGRCIELIEALGKGAAADPHLRYETAWHVAKHADLAAFTKLLTSGDPDVRLAGLIAIDVACYENLPTKKTALEALAGTLENPGKLDHQLLLTVAQLGGDASIVPALEKLIARDDLPTATIAKAVLVLKAKSGGSLASGKLSAAAGKRLIEAVEKGSLRIASPADQLVIFEFLESEGPTPFALKQIAGQLQSSNKELRLAAHTLARRFGPKASSLVDPLWPTVLNPKTKFEDAIESLSTIARIEQHKERRRDEWKKLLDHEDRFVRAEAVRWWRKHAGDQPLTDMLVKALPRLTKKDATLDDEELKAVFSDLQGHPRDPVDKDELTKYALKELAAMPAAEQPRRAAMGLQVFERSACTKCHTTATQTTPLAPSLKGIAAQKVDYLIESLLYPSKVIKTGFETEIIELKSGKTLSGLVKDDGKHLRILNLDRDEKIAKSDVESRSLSKTSIMPEGQEASLSRRELVDLIAYLMTLK